MRHSIVFDLAENKLVVNNQDHAKSGPQTRTGNFAFAGLSDRGVIDNKSAIRNRLNRLGRQQAASRHDRQHRS